MRPCLLVCLAACVALASCSISEEGLKRSAVAGDFSFAETVTPDFAEKAASKSPELPLFLALKLLASSEKSPQTDQAARDLLAAAAGFSRDSSGALRINSKLQGKIPFLNRAAALFRLCALTRQAAGGLSAAYTGGQPSAEEESLRRDALFLEDVLNGKERGFLLSAAGGVEFPLSSLNSFSSAKQAISDTLALTQPVSSNASSIENEAAALRRLAAGRHYNVAAALFFRIAARLGYSGQLFSCPAMEDTQPFSLDEAAMQDESAAEAGESLKSLPLNRGFLSAAGRSLLYSEAEPAASAAALEYLLEAPGFGGGEGIPESRETQEARYVLKFYLARIYAKMPGQADAAFAMMESSLLDAPTDEDFDFSLWYMLDFARSGGNGRLLDAIEASAPEWRDSNVFSDILTTLITDLARGRDIDSLLRLEAALPDAAPYGIRERVAFSVALLSPAGSRDEAERLELLSESAGSLYYRTRSAQLLGKELPVLGWDGEATGAASGYEAARAFPAEFAGQAAALIRESVDWNMPRQAAAFTENFPFAKFRAVEDEARRLIKGGQLSNGMRLLSAAFSQLGPEAARIGAASRETMEMLYPQAWRAEVASAAAATQADGEPLGALPESLIFAVIRQESFFDPNALSHAGAKGLMQLMDLTAAEVAEKLKTPEYNLFSPETSIRFGSFYLSEMKRRLSGESLQAVCAYNAGIGRVRGWLRDFPPNLDGKSPAAEECLFVESVPFNETRDYAKRVFTSEAVYSALYY